MLNHRESNVPKLKICYPVPSSEFPGSLTFTELTSVTRTSGGEYAVLLKTFGPIPAFMFVWSIEIARNPASRAVQTLTFAEYLSSFLELCGSPVLPKRLVAICVLCKSICVLYKCRFNCVGPLPEKYIASLST